MDPIFDNLRLALYTASRSALGREWNYGYLLDPFSRLYYIESGEAVVRLRDGEFILKPLHLYIIPAYVEHQAHCAKRVVINWLHFNVTLFGGLSLFDYLQCDYEIKLKQPYNYRSLLKRLRRAFRSDKPGAGFEWRGLLMQCLGPVIDAAKARESVRHEFLRFREVLEYIDAHLGEPLKVPVLASMAHLAPTSFSRLFASVFGIPPARYVLRKRLETAQRILWETDKTLAAIATELGFADAFHLSKVFKRVIGISPKEFRRRERFVTP